MPSLITDDNGKSDIVDDLIPTTTTPFVDDLGNFTDTITETVGVFPLMLALLLRIHATWLLFMLIPS